MSSGKYVFLSYSSKDSEEINKITELVKSMGIDYWKAPEKIPAGSSYAKEIVKAIENCSLFLILLSSNAQDSIWVEKEVDCALCSNRTIIPFNIDGCQLNGSFKFYLNNVQIIFQTRDSDSGTEQLKALLEPLIPEDRKNRTDLPQAKTASALSQKLAAAHFKEKINSEPETHELNKEHRVLQKYKRGMNPDDFWTLNRIPSECQYCGGPLEHRHDGVYLCKICKAENYDDFQTIRNYLLENGPCSVSELSLKLGIPLKIVRNWRDTKGR